MEQKPNGVLNSRFRHKCLNLHAKRYNELAMAALVGQVDGIYHSFSNNSVISISNVVESAWEIGKPQNIDEERALFFLCGNTYSDTDMKMSCAALYHAVKDKIGINLDVDPDIKLSVINDTIKDIVGEDDTWSQIQSEGLQETPGKIVQPQDN